eukprot:4444516-Pleurochrysis_carterae.AAC.1
MAQSLIKVSSRAFVALRLKSTQRTAGYAEAEKKRKKKIRADRAPGSPKASPRGSRGRRRLSFQQLVQAGLERGKAGQDEDWSVGLRRICQ